MTPIPPTREAAFRRLFEAHHDRVRAYLRAALIDAAAAGEPTPLRQDLAANC